jgi:uncharacterized protein YjeT (DUF2065 family)
VAIKKKEVTMSIILAKIFGIYLLAVGLAFFINPDRFKRIYQHVAKDENFLFFGGILALLIGAIIVSLHNDWALKWSLIITVLGWWSLIKGFALLIYPAFIKLFSFMQNRSNIFYRMISLIYIAIGLFLAYKGFA